MGLELPKLTAAVFAIALFATTASRFTAQQAPVVSNPAPTPNSPTFRVSAQPVLKFGGLNDDERYELLGTSAAIIANGRLFVAPNPRGGSSHEIRVIDAAGRFVRRIGRAGDGPGEFRWITDMAMLSNGSLAVVDVTASRVTIMDTLGTVTATLPYGGRTTCCFADGSFLQHRNPSSVVRPGEASSSLALTLMPPTPSPSGGKQILSLQWSDTAMRIGPFQRAGRDGRATTTFNTPPKPFSRTAMLKLSGSEIIHSTGDSYEYKVYSKEGNMLRTVRAALAPTPVTSSDITAWRNSLMQVAVTPEMQRGFSAAIDRVQFPATMPAISAMHVDATGTVWLRNYSRATPPDYWWARFDNTGKLLGTLRLPPDRSVLRFMGDHVILSQRDTATETQILSVHRIETVPR